MPSLLLAAVLAATPKLAIPEFSGVNLAPNEATLYANALAGALSRGGLEVLTSRDLATLLGMERQKQLLGCSESSCFTELVGALGADAVVLGDIGRLGSGYVVQLKVLASQQAQVLALFSAQAADGAEVVKVLERGAVDVQNQLAAKWNRPELVRAVQAPVNRRWVSYVVGGVGLGAVLAGLLLNLPADQALNDLRRGVVPVGDAPRPRASRCWASAAPRW
jgi:hypothetical protein